MSAVQPIRFETGRPLLVAGVRRVHTGPDILGQVGRQWRDFHARPVPAGRIGTDLLGVALGGDDCRLDYLCGVPVRTFEGLPASSGRARIPAVQYAVFAGAGSVADIHRLWADVRTRWLNESGYKSAHTPDFERFGADFDWTQLAGAFELWVGCTS